MNLSKSIIVMLLICLLFTGCTINQNEIPNTDETVTPSIDDTINEGSVNGDNETSNQPNGQIRDAIIDRIAEQQGNSDEQNGQRYSYNENDGIYMFYETEEEVLYRKLLPEEFGMPDNLMVQLFIMDFYDINSEADPYKEMSIYLLAEHEGEEVWHCIYMPVTSEQSMIAGQIGLGLPKTMGDIEFIREDGVFTGTIVDKDDRSATITVDTTDYIMSETEEEQIKGLIDLPKINLLNGETIQMTRAGGAVNIIDASNRYPNLIKVIGGEATISFDDIDGETLHPFDLEPTEVIAAYYMHNQIQFSLDRE